MTAMIRNILTPISRVFIRNYHVSILGGASELGQSVGLLLRTLPSVSKLTLHGQQELIPGVTLDLSHIPTTSALQGYFGDETIEKSLKDVDLVLVTGDSSLHPGMSGKHWFKMNYNFIKTIFTKIAKLSPIPFVGIAMEPINTLVPMAAEIMSNNGAYNPKKLFGITSVDLLKAQSMFATENHLNPRDCVVPVIGGHSDNTLIPLLSLATPACDLNKKQVQELTAKIRTYDSSTIKELKGWSPSLSVAYGVQIFTRGIIEALDGRVAQIHAYVENNDFGTSYFSGVVNVDQKGIVEMQRYSNLSEYERHLLEKSVIELKKEVLLGKKILEFE